MRGFGLKNYLNVLEYIFKFANLSIQTRYNLLIVAILVVLGYIIIDQDKKMTALQDENRAITIGCNARIDVIRDNCDREVSDCKETFFKYLEQNEKDYRAIMFEAKKIKEVVYENPN